MRIVRAVMAAGFLLLLTVGTPFALLAWGAPAGDWLRWGVPDDGRALRLALTGVAWLAWVTVACSVLAEVANVVARRPVVSLPVIGGLQAMVGGLVLAAFSVSFAAPPSSAAPAPRPLEAVAAQESEPRTTRTVDGYLVLAGDDLWTIAERTLGEGARWREIAAANPQMVDSPTRDLVPGTLLRLPAPPTSAGGSSAPRKVVTVTPGDSLSGLALEHLGSASEWPRIHQANRDLIGDPDLISVGWKVVIPASTGRGDPGEPEKSRPNRRATSPEGVASAIPERGPDHGIAPSAPSIRATAPHSTPAIAGQGARSTTAAEPSPVSAAAHEQSERGPRPAVLSPDTDDPTLPLTGGMGALAAAMVLGGLELRRTGQLRTRPIGRRIAHPTPDVQRYEVALGRRERPDQLILLERALRRIGRHCHDTGTPLPVVEQVTISDDCLEFRWQGPASPPPEPFQGSTRAWRITGEDADLLPADPHPVPYPALVTLGVASPGEWIMIDLELAELVGLRGDSESRLATLSSMLVELGSAPWSDEMALTVIGGEAAFAQSAPSGLVTVCDSVEEGVERVERIAQHRASAFHRDGINTATLRVDPDRADAVAGHVFLFCDTVDAEQHQRLARALEGRQLALAAIVGTTDPAQARWVVRNPEAPVLSSIEDAVEVRAAAVPRHTREAIVAMVEAMDETAHTPAPWWREADELGNVRTLKPRRAVEDTEPVQIIELAERIPRHPQLRLIGPIELVAAAGQPPARARRQCEEYCGWLLENPGRTATAMSRELLVADGTRRSNMSRLRTWLGEAPDGRAYLPEAYSGRISLDPAVTSDWQHLQILAAPGLNHLSRDALIAVLDAVRGAPLADAAPGQWHWAEELRTDIASLLRDAGVILAEQARLSGDLDLARWATTRALIAAPEDEYLIRERIRIEHRAGNGTEVERLVLRVTRQARTIGVDLQPETVRLCQEVMEGRVRVRAL